MDRSYSYNFPSIRGTQAGRDYFVTMCPMKLIPKIFIFNEEESLPAELRAQRVLNRGRLPEMVSYLLENPGSYVFSAICASIDGEVNFQSSSSNDGTSKVGVLEIPMSSRFIINDGQHRRAAIEKAILESPSLAEEHIAVVFFVDQGLKRSQQMFADLNRHAIKPSSSLGVLYDHRDSMADVARHIALYTGVFQGLVETERATLALKSRKLFTLSSIYRATTSLFKNIEITNEVQKKLGQEFWAEIGYQMPEWDQVQSGHLLAQEVRSEFIHTHGVVLHALGKIGNNLLLNYERDREDTLSNNHKAYISKLKNINWRRTNPYWEGRTMIEGRVSKSEICVALTIAGIKKLINLDLSHEERELEINKMINLKKGTEK